MKRHFLGRGCPVTARQPKPALPPRSAQLALGLGASIGGPDPTEEAAFFGDDDGGGGGSGGAGDGDDALRDEAERQREVRRAAPTHRSAISRLRPAFGSRGFGANPSFGRLAPIETIRTRSVLARREKRRGTPIHREAMARAPRGRINRGS